MSWPTYEPRLCWARTTVQLAQMVRDSTAFGEFVGPSGLDIGDHIHVGQVEPPANREVYEQLEHNQKYSFALVGSPDDEAAIEWVLDAAPRQWLPHGVLELQFARQLISPGAEQTESYTDQDLRFQDDVEAVFLELGQKIDDPLQLWFHRITLMGNRFGRSKVDEAPTLGELIFASFLVLWGNVENE